MSETKEIVGTTSSTATKECPSCGKINNARNTYCVKCRTRLPETVFSEGRLPTGELAAPPPVPSAEITRMFSDISLIKMLLVNRTSALRLRQIYFDLGIVLSQQQEYNKATEAFQQALSTPAEDDPKTSDILLSLAYTQEEAGNSEQAFHTYLETVLHETAHACPILSHMQALLTADIVISQGEWVIDACLPRISDTAIAVSTRRDMALLVVRLYLYLANYTQAEEVLKQAMSFAPDDVPASVDELLAPDRLPPNLASYPTDSNASYILALLYAATGNMMRATTYIDHALELLANGSGPAGKSAAASFEADAYQLKAQLQAKAALSKASGRREDAAQSLLEAAQQHYFKNELKPAIALFRAAKELNPAQQSIYWYLADCLRMSSQENPAILQESVEVWEQGYILRPMDDDNAWAYLVRGLIYELQSYVVEGQPWVTAWRAACCAEQAMVYPSSALNSTNYAYLGHFYRNIQLEANALEATAKAVQLDEKNIFALTEHAIISANMGEFEQAKQVIEKWLQLEPDAGDAIAIRGYVDWHEGRKEEGIDQLTRAIEQNEDVLWYRAVRGYFYRFQGDYDLATQDYTWVWNKYEETGKVDFDNIYRYATAAFMLGKYDETLNILNKVPPDAPFNDANSWYGSIGSSYLALGQLERGEEALNTCIALLCNQRQLSDQRAELRDLVTISESWTHKEQIPAIIERLEERIQQRSRELEKPISAEEELLAIVERTEQGVQSEYASEPANIVERVKERIRQRNEELEKPILSGEELLPIVEQIVQEVQSECELESGEKREEAIHSRENATAAVDSSDGWAWVAAMAGRARIFAEQRHWIDAVKVYYDLYVRAKDRFPEARLGIEMMCDHLLDEMVRCYRENLPIPYYYEIRDAVRDAIQHLLAVIPDDKQRLARACAQFVYFDLPQASEKGFNLATLADLIVNVVVPLQLYRDSNTAEPGVALGHVWRSMVNDISFYWQIDEFCQGCIAVFRKLAEEGKADVKLHNDFIAAGEALSEYLDDCFQLKEQEQSTESSPFAPVAIPIALEIGLDLVPSDAMQAEGKWPIMAEYIPAMRQRLKDETGIEIPGIQIRDNLSLRPNQFAVCIDGVRVFTDSILMGYCYIPASPEALKAGITRYPAFEIVRPLTGETGYWMAASYAETLRNNGVEVWTDPFLYLAAQFELVLRQNMANFLGMREVAYLLTLWNQNQKDGEFVRTLLLDTDASFHFTRLLQALVRASIPITPLENIIAAVQGLDLAHSSMNDIVRAVQSNLKYQQTAVSVGEKEKTGGTQIGA